MNLETLTIGSISTGTLLMTDLIAAMLDATDRLDVTIPADLRTDAEHASLNALPGDESHEIYTSLEDYLTEELPPYIRFGVLEGDPADLGFWWADWCDEELGEALLAADRAADGDSNDHEIDSLRDAVQLLMERLAHHP